MTTSDSAWKEIMQYSFLHVFANDRVIDASELAMLEKLTLADGKVDEHERSILSRIFSRVSKETESPETWDEICRFKARFDIP